MPKIIVPILGEIEPGTSREAREAEKFRKERGLDGVSITESEQAKKDKSLREAMVLKALGVKVDEKKKADEKKPEPFADLRKELKELEESLTREGVEYFPLREFREKLDGWSKEVSLKESDDFEDEFSDVKKSAVRIAKEVHDFKKKQ